MDSVTARTRARCRTLKPYPHSLPAILMRAREAVMARIRPVLRAYEVTEPQWRVLRTLCSVEEVEVTQLADMVFLLPSSLSRILRDLGERGLITRRTSEEDLRRGWRRRSGPRHGRWWTPTPGAPPRKTCAA